MSDGGGVPERNGVPMYDSREVEKLMEEGYSYNEAVRIAASEMDGAYQGPEGNINSTQTGCNHLRYDEGLPDSKGAKEGEETTLKAIARHYNLSSLTSKEAGAIVDEILKKGRNLTPDEVRRVLKRIRNKEGKKKTK